MQEVTKDSDFKYTTTPSFNAPKGKLLIAEKHFNLPILITAFSSKAQ